MIKVPDALWRKFERYLAAAEVLDNDHRAYKKWLRYYLDFCSKYKHGYADAASIPPFLEKLKSKRQVPAAREQAARSVGIYHKMVRDADRDRRQARPRPVAAKMLSEEAGAGSGQSGGKHPGAGQDAVTRPGFAVADAPVSTALHCDRMAGRQGCGREQADGGRKNGRETALSPATVPGSAGDQRGGAGGGDSETGQPAHFPA